MDYDLSPLQGEWSPESIEFFAEKLRTDPDNTGSIAIRKYLLKQHRPRKRATATPKVQIPSALRWVVWERDDFTCQHCGTRRDLSVDHIMPESKGGTLDLDNLQTLCRSCNSRKGAR